MMQKTMASTRVGSSSDSVAALACQLLKQGRCLKLKARGGSMTPFLRDGDIALIAPAERPIRVGDVIGYQTAAGRLFLHRVILRGGTRVVVKGDALSSADVIALSEVVGTVTAIERHGKLRRLDTRAARWTNCILAVLSPALSGLLPVLIGIRRLTRAIGHG